MAENEECLFCVEQERGGLYLMMNDALKAKYTQPTQSPSSFIDTLLNLCPPSNAQDAIATSKHKQFNYLDEDQEFMKRQYNTSEFLGKINMLTEYYKFHNDIPRVLELGVQKIMARYYDRRRGVDYKKIKKVLKNQQGISITSAQDSLSSITHSQMPQKKSRYSTLLNALQPTKGLEESQILFAMCKQIQAGIPLSLPVSKFQVKGSFQTHANFQKYLEWQQKKQKNLRNTPKQVKTEGHRILRNFNYKQFLRDKNAQGSTTIANKEHKFIYNSNINTNAKIQIRNAMFYSEAPQPNDNQQFKKKGSMNSSKTNKYSTNHQHALQVYKSKGDLKLRQRVTASGQQNSKNKLRSEYKRNLLSEQSRQKKIVKNRSSLRRQGRSLSVRNIANRKGTQFVYQGGVEKNNRQRAIVAYKQGAILFGESQQARSKTASRSQSTSSFKRRQSTINSAVNKKLEAATIESKTRQPFSRYDSSALQGSGAGSVSIKQLLARKIRFTAEN